MVRRNLKHFYDHFDDQVFSAWSLLQSNRWHSQNPWSWTSFKLHVFRNQFYTRLHILKRRCSWTSLLIAELVPYFIPKSKHGFCLGTPKTLIISLPLDSWRISAALLSEKSKLTIICTLLLIPFKTGQFWIIVKSTSNNSSTSLLAYVINILTLTAICIFLVIWQS